MIEVADRLWDNVTVGLGEGEKTGKSAVGTEWRDDFDPMKIRTMRLEEES